LHALFTNSRKLKILFADKSSNEKFLLSRWVEDEEQLDEDVNVILKPLLSLPKYALKLPKPIIVLGLPKSGTTSIYHFFRCAGIPSSHYCCSPGASDHPPCYPEGTVQREREYHKCGFCIERNLRKGLPPLHGCGDKFDVFAQIDTEMVSYDIDKRSGKLISWGRMYLPQVTELENLNLHYPNATFILNLRDPASWERSVKNWFNLAAAFRRTHLPDYHYPDGKMALQEFYSDHNERIRNFVKKYPSHTLVEVNIEDEKAGDQLANAFGLDSSCWTKSNARHGEGKTNS